MPTRKQRRRRAKTRRHEYGFVVSDEEGNEVEVAGSELRAQKGAGAKPKSAPTTQTAAKGSRRTGREPDRPSWRRSFRRAALWSPAIIAVSYLILRGLTVPVRILFGVGYAALFIPMTYWMDSLVYRRFERRKAAEGQRPGKSK